ncbi:MAG: DUF1153 domain-containing protein [Alphaproteobacteria bacterium]|nr:DUF1153 domain-containing protein [Alphaproteobacteria bacterium]
MSDRRESSLPSRDPGALALPPPDTARWVPRRKAAVVAAVRQGLLSLGEACERYTISVDEFLSWQMAFEKGGVPGLRVTVKAPSGQYQTKLVGNNPTG